MGRRDAIRAGLAGLAGAALLPAAGTLATTRPSPEPLFRISLAEWSLHRALKAGRLDHVNFARVAREDYGLDAVEYVNTFFKDKATNADYLKMLKARAGDHGVRILLIMCDGEGRLGDPEEAARLKAVENHRKWVEAARTLGCHSIRVNAASEGAYDEQMKLAADGLRRLAEIAAPYGLNVIVENHGGLSSNGAWLAGVMKAAGHYRCGTLPDFGNFCLDWSRKDDPAAWYDRYKGVAEMMPYAKAVSAKSNDFDARGNETATDYRRMMMIVLDAGYRGYVGIEYEGETLPEEEGIRKTKALLERVREALS
ncbi:MAG: sugar phosphate isomerase/epimerase family protein [Phycisphaerales bacterium]